MCVAELALPVLPGLFLGPAQKFSIVFKLEVLSSQRPRCPPESSAVIL